MIVVEGKLKVHLCNKEDLLKTKTKTLIARSRM
jgi:hypothetical protein